RRRGYDVHGLDNLSRATRESIKVLEESGVEYRVVDITSPGQVVNAVKLFKPNVLVHLAALVDVEESIRKLDLYVYVNVYGTSVVVRKALECSVERIVYISSAAVYGQPRRLPVSEEHSVEPINPYGATKLAGEHLVKVMCRLAHKHYVVLRLFNVYGPRQNPSYAGVVVKTWERIAVNKPPIVYGDGMQTRDMVYVEDVVKAIEKAIETRYVDEVYNIGSGKPVRIKDLINLILELVGKKS
ncbi:MAG TPA: NAD-dependent epimerase/dehydratase family protein, partial [Pyrodictium sp.]|nr:NAD-dependent epimerase/dehydratase family protein [Pyrodictium sp.]